ncbi:type III secretion system chaperone [Acanthopleuribacter pedis]|uniref:Type III secretion system chaperone n=1 Tax=Acanthopleuribacter pedis TaxID=442870 RepID=A0A8J7U736_9BACT|nr:type III secretion system chaperone [Acanthopleuribacter pedis]MBO1322078.1 type III secretion system chaperone [Acanthopleuribacter pedis]
MQHHPILETYLSEFAHKHNAQFHEGDEQGFAVITFADETSFHFHLEPETQSITAFSILGVVPEKNRLNIFSYALGSNLFQGRTRGATLGLDEECSALVLQRSLQLNDFQPVAFQEALEALMEVAELWRGYLAEAHRVAGQPDEPTGAAAKDAKLENAVMGRLLFPTQFA